MARYMHTSSAKPGGSRKRSTSKSTLKKGLNAGKNVIHGKIISLDFFSRHWIGVAIGVVLLVWYITNKYECRTSMERVQALEKQLDIVKGDYINEHSTYMSCIREASLEKLAKDNKLDLRVQDEPPYKLTYDNR